MSNLEIDPRRKDPSSDATFQLVSAFKIASESMVIENVLVAPTVDPLLTLTEKVYVVLPSGGKLLLARNPSIQPV
jgi:hypothetical protein